jgi:prepilin peptidase CpaA
MPVDVILSCVLIGTLALATREDMLKHRIPNVLCAAAFAIGLFLQLTAHGVDGAVSATLGAMAGLAMFFPFYLLKGMGAGDVKLMGAIGVFLGPIDTLLAGALTLTFGAVLAVGVLVHRKLSTPSRIELLLAEQASHATFSALRKQRFPYAVAIALGTLALMWREGDFARLREVLFV